MHKNLWGDGTMIVYTNNINMVSGGMPLVIHIGQYDSDFSLVFNLVNSKGAFTLQSGTTAEIRGTKTDGNGYSADATIDVSNSTVTISGSAQMTAAAGFNTFELVLKKSNKVLSTANFILDVERAAMDAGTITSDSVLKELNAIIAGAETATAAAEDAREAAGQAEAAAQTLEIDATLTRTGQAADAKKVGDEILDLKDNLDAISEGDIEYTYEPLTYDPVYFDRTRQGIRFVQKADGTVDVSGTNDGSGSSLLGLQDVNGIHFFQLSANKTYCLTGCPSGGGSNSYNLNIRKSTGGTLFADYGNGVIFSPPDDDGYQIVVMVSKNFAVGGTITFNPLLEEREIDSTLTAIDQVARNDLSEIMDSESQYIYNPLSYTPVSIDRTRQGVHFVQNTNGTVQASGANDGTGSSFWGMQDADGIHFFELKADKTYRLTGCPAGGDSTSKYDINIRKQTGGTLFADTGNGVIFTPPDDDLYQVVVSVRNNYSVSGTLTFSPLLEEQIEIQNGVTAVDKFARKGLGLFNNTVVTPQMFGAVGDGITDDSLAVMGADAFNGASVVFFPPGVYNISGVTAHKSWIMAEDAWITTTTHNGVPVTIAGNGNTYRLNCDYTGINPSRGVLVTGNKNHIEQIIINGMVYDSTNRFGSAGLLITGDYNTVDFARFFDFINDQGDNDSAPQGAALLDDATGNYFADIYTYNVRAGFVNAANYGTVNSIGTIKNENSHDNAVYCVRGGYMSIEAIIHDGDDEGLCVITDTNSDLTTVDVGTLFCKNCDVAIRIKNAGDVRIGQAFLKDCNCGIRLDLNNVESKSLIIDDLQMYGKMVKPMYIAADGLRGKLDHLRINNLYVKHDLEGTWAAASDLNTYIEVSAVDKLYIGKCEIDFLADGSVFQNSNPVKMVLNSNPVDRSYVGKCKIISSRHDMLITPIGQDNMKVLNGLITNDGVKVDKEGLYDSDLFASTAPQSGTWKKGQRISSTDTNVAEYVCTISGTPGTWKSVQLT